MRVSAGVLCVVALMLSESLVGSHEAAARRSVGEWVQIKAGQDHRYRWAMLVKRAGGRVGPRRPCVAVAIANKTTGHVARGSVSLWVCSSLALPYPPNIVESSAGRGVSKVRVMGIAAAPRLKRLTLELSSGEEQGVRLDGLTQREVRGSQIQRGVFGLAVLRGEACVEHMVGYDSRGQVIYQGPGQICPDFG
jgi:hypothetical protein